MKYPSDLEEEKLSHQEIKILDDFIKASIEKKLTADYFFSDLNDALRVTDETRIIAAKCKKP